MNPPLPLYVLLDTSKLPNNNIYLKYLQNNKHLDFNTFFSD